MGAVILIVRRELRRSPVSALATTVVVAVSGALVLMLAAGTVRTSSAPDRYEASLAFIPEATVEQPSGAALTSEIGGLPSVESVASATFVFGGLVDEHGELLDALVFAGEVTASGTIVDGREPDPAAPDEFAATTGVLEATGLRIGDEVDLITFTQSDAERLGFDAPLPSEPTLRATLVGEMSGPSEDDFPLAYFSPALLDTGDIGTSASFHMVSLAPGATLADLRTQLDRLPEGADLGLEPAEIVTDETRRAVSTLSRGLAILAVIVGLATTVILVQLLNRQARGPQGRATILSALGFTTRQCRLDPVARLAVPVTAGAGLAAVVAVWASDRFPRGFVKDLEPDPGRQVDLLVHLVGPVALALGLLLGVYVTSRQEAAMLGAGRATTGRSPRVRFGLLGLLGPLGLATRVGISLRDRSRSATSGFVGLVVVLAILLGALTFGVSLGSLLDDPERHGQDVIGLGQGGTEVPAESIDVLTADADISDLAVAGSAIATIGSEATDMSGFELIRGDVLPEPFDGRQPATADEVALGQVTAREHDLQVGDDVVIVGADGPATFHVVGISMVLPVAGADGLGEGGHVTAEGLRRLDPAAAMGEALLRLRPGAPPDTADRLSAAVGQAIGRRSQPPPIVNLGRVRDIPWVVAAALAALAVLSLGHQLVLSLIRRRHDMAVLESLGATRPWLRTAICSQAAIHSAAALAVALPIGLAGGRLVFRSLAWSIGARQDIVVPVGWFSLSAGALLALALVVATSAMSIPRPATAAARLRRE